MTEIRSVCVFCGARRGNDPVFGEAAQALGRILADAGVKLIYGGGRIGLMGMIAQAAADAGGHVTGIIPTHLLKLEIGNVDAAELIETDSMHSRKQKMFELADGFVILPGGLGTLDESFEILTWKQLRTHNKPVCVLDVGGYWQPLVALIEHVVRADFAGPSNLEMFEVVATPEGVLPALKGEDLEAAVRRL